MAAPQLGHQVSLQVHCEHSAIEGAAEKLVCDPGWEVAIHDQCTKFPRLYGGS